MYCALSDGNNGPAGSERRGGKGWSVHDEECVSKKRLLPKIVSGVLVCNLYWVGISVAQCRILIPFQLTASVGRGRSGASMARKREVKERLLLQIIPGVGFS